MRVQRMVRGPIHAACIPREAHLSRQCDLTRIRCFGASTPRGDSIHTISELAFVIMKLGKEIHRHPHLLLALRRSEDVPTDQVSVVIG